MRHFYLKRIKNGESFGIVDVPENDLEETLNNHPEWKNMGEVKLSKFKPPKSVVGVTECPLCGLKVKSAAGLKKHKETHYV